MKIKIFQFPHGKGLPVPSYGTDQSAGKDLYAAVNEPVLIKAGERALISTGVGIILPKDIDGSYDGSRYEAQIRPRSGLALKYGITVLNSPGTIDADYHDEIRVILINHGGEDFFVSRGMRIAQIVVARCEVIDFETVEFENYHDIVSNRGGFGSTGE
jgi:dUTP pyrophosphatase